ncbi:reverse transcriptase [Aphelenchoides avenae]|nr:reverse transcriptase [Aphelenchus avenae]
MGDFNARIGSQLAGEQYIGPFTDEARNEPGQRMSSFAEAKQLYVMNSFFPKPVRKRWTWQSADGVTRSEVDYVLCDHAQTVTNVEVLSRFEARSDHRIVRALMLNLPQLKKDRIQNGKKKIPSTVSDELLRTEVEGAEWPSHSDKRINARCESLEAKLLDCVKAAEFRRPSQRGSRITEETKTLMKRLQMLKQNGGDPEECRNLSREVRTRLVADYDDYRNARLMEAAAARESLKKCKRKMAQSQLVTGSLRDTSGQLQTERRRVEDICRDYYASLFESKVHVPKAEPVPEGDEEPLPRVTTAEVEAALKRLKNGKAPGPDGITAEMLKAAGTTLWDQIAKFFTQCLKAKQIPLKWKESRTVLLFKKGDPEDLKNYRPICLLPVMYKLFTKVILNRITGQLDAAQPNEQAGFRSGFCTFDHMQVMNQLQEKAREKNLKLYLIFIDYEKAFDSIEINAVLNAIQKQGVQQQYVDVLENVYDGCTTEVKLFEEPIAIPIGRGVRQGDTISQNYSQRR